MHYCRCSTWRDSHLTSISMTVMHQRTPHRWSPHSRLCCTHPQTVIADSLYDSSIIQVISISIATVVSAALITKLSALMHRTIHRSSTDSSRLSWYQLPQSHLPHWFSKCHRWYTVQLFVHRKIFFAYLNINRHNCLWRSDPQTVIADARYNSSFIQEAVSATSISY